MVELSPSWDRLGGGRRRRHPAPRNHHGRRDGARRSSSAIVGIAKIVQAFETKEWPGFFLQLLARR